MGNARKAIERHLALFSRRGVSATDFGLIAALIAIAIIAAAMLLSDVTLG